MLATPVMINMMEAAALDAIERLLPEGHQSLGTHLECRALCGNAGGNDVCAQPPR